VLLNKEERNVYVKGEERGVFSARGKQKLESSGKEENQGKKGRRRRSARSWNREKRDERTAREGVKIMMQRGECEYPGGEKEG